MKTAASSETDLVVVGGGPGGAATAILCAMAGQRVVLIERSSFPRSQPGESLHPGVFPLLKRLGVAEAVLAAGFLRHRGHVVSWGGPPRFVPFGSGDHGPWLGLHAWRPRFDALLLGRVRRLGVLVEQPGQARRAIQSGGKVIGVITDNGRRQARFVVDATGRRSWLAQQLGLKRECASPPLTAWYGYTTGCCPERDDVPALTADGDGWTWVARVRPTVYQWTRLNFDGQRPDRDWLPPELAGLERCQPTRGADVTWRIVSAPAGSGYFLVGDAAAVLDPASSHGVLKALMSGMMAGHLIANVAARKLDPMDAADFYTRWLRDWFEHDVRKLNELYTAVARPLL